jgi:serine/threonine-protein kinase RsbW
MSVARSNREDDPRRRQSFRYTIGSDFEAGRRVQERIMEQLSRRGFNSSSAFAVRLALEEALINAIKHGNQLDPEKKVRIRGKVTPARAEIIIEDEGGGFDRGVVPDPTVDENLEKCTGRGILLIESYMNEVEWSRGGRRLRMVKKNEPDVLPRC